MPIITLGIRPNKDRFQRDEENDMTVNLSSVPGMGYYYKKRQEKWKNQMERLKESLKGGPIFAKCVIAWKAQRPDHIFADRQLLMNQYQENYGKDEIYNPDDIYTLTAWRDAILDAWSPDNSLGLSDRLRAIREHSNYFHLFAISQCFSIASDQSRYVPKPHIAYQQALESELIKPIAHLAAKALDSALNLAASEPLEDGDIFMVENWFRSKKSLSDISNSVDRHLAALSLNERVKVKQALRLEGKDFQRAILFTTSGHPSLKA